MGKARKLRREQARRDGTLKQKDPRDCRRCGLRMMWDGGGYSCPLCDLAEFEERIEDDMLDGGF
jgi:tRNA(Ile2) C34 agmatinyltransferase TiaS